MFSVFSVSVNRPYRNIVPESVSQQYNNYNNEIISVGPAIVAKSNLNHYSNPCKSALPFPVDTYTLVRRTSTGIDVPRGIITPDYIRH